MKDENQLPESYHFSTASEAIRQLGIKSIHPLVSEDAELPFALSSLQSSLKSLQNHLEPVKTLSDVLRESCAPLAGHFFEAVNISGAFADFEKQSGFIGIQDQMRQLEASSEAALKSFSGIATVNSSLSDALTDFRGTMTGLEMQMAGSGLKAQKILAGNVSFSIKGSLGELADSYTPIAQAIGEVGGIFANLEKRTAGSGIAALLGNAGQGINPTCFESFAGTVPEFPLFDSEVDVRMPQSFVAHTVIVDEPLYEENSDYTEWPLFTEAELDLMEAQADYEAEREYSEIVIKKGLDGLSELEIHEERLSRLIYEANEQLYLTYNNDFKRHREFASFKTIYSIKRAVLRRVVRRYTLTGISLKNESSEASESTANGRAFRQDVINKRKRKIVKVLLIENRQPETLSEVFEEREQRYFREWFQAGHAGTDWPGVDFDKWRDLARIWEKDPEIM